VHGVDDAIHPGELKIAVAGFPGRPGGLADTHHGVAGVLHERDVLGEALLRHVLVVVGGAVEHGIGAPVRAGVVRSEAMYLSRRSWALAVLAALSLHAEDGFQPLFNGKDLSGWTLVEKHGTGYLVEDGKIVCPRDGGGNLFTEREYGNFVLRFEFRLEEGSNSGIGIRSPLKGDAAYAGMEIQILDHDAPVYRGKLKPSQMHGSIYDVFPAKTGHLRPTGQWNEEEIVANGNRITVKLNGAVIVEADLSTVTDPEVLKRHPGLRRTSGHIGLLGHNTRVEFRNLRIRVL
jgi:hypothetical protein